MPPPTRTNGTAIAALVFALLFAPLGLVLAYIARGQIRRTGEGGIGLAKAAMIIGWITLLPLLAGVGAVILAAVTVWLRSPDAPPAAVPPSAAKSSGVPALDRPSAAQDASCPDVQAVVVAGTGETSNEDDPSSPGKFPQALLLNVTRPLAEQFGSDRLQVTTVPYAAQFHNPFITDGQMSYNDSRAEGARNAVKVISDTHSRCPLTTFVLTGYSQGAVIAGDIASEIGNGKGPIASELVLGVSLISDSRRQSGVGQGLAPNPPGDGAEVVFANVPMLSTLGATMTGARSGGFGSLDARVHQICAVGDVHCSASAETSGPANLPKLVTELSSGAGQDLYTTTRSWALDGRTAVEWTLNWAADLVSNAPRPTHS